MAADWLELDSEIEGIRFDSELALKQEVAYAAHLHVSNLILPAPRNPANVTDYARAVANILAVPGYLTFSIRIPVSDVTASPAASSSEAAAAVQGGNASTRTWEMWNTIRSMCAYSPRLSVCLDLSTPLPGQHIYSRWFAEPVKSIFLPASSYLANAKGYPVLSKNSQSFCKQIFKYKPAFILSGIHKGLHQSGGPEAYTS
jgi:protein arginine N-methyltransferase 5